LGYNTTGKGLQHTHTSEGWKGVTGTGQERDRGHTGDTRRERRCGLETDKVGGG
jgi:hypothetical protein